MDKLLYPETGKEVVITLSMVGDDNVVGTLFPRYIGLGGQAFQSARYRLNLFKEELHAGLVSVPKGDVNDSRLEKTRINPRLIDIAGEPKQVDIPSDIQAMITEGNTLLAKDELTDDEKQTLRKDIDKLDFYFSASRNFAV